MIYIEGTILKAAIVKTPKVDIISRLSLLITVVTNISKMTKVTSPNSNRYLIEDWNKIKFTFGVSFQLSKTKHCK